MFEVNYVKTDDPAVEQLLGLSRQPEAKPVVQEDTRLTNEASEPVRDYRKGVKAESKALGYVGTITLSAKGAPIGHEPFNVFVNRVLDFDSRYGKKWLILMEDEAGNAIVNWASKEPNWALDSFEDELISIRAVVKSHEEHEKYGPQTTVIKVKVD